MDRFWSKVDRGAPDDCWMWTGSVSDTGYPTFWAGAGRNRVYAHRFAYEMNIGPIPDGLTIDHLCGVTTCVNPGHLEAVTQAENILRARTGVAAANSRKKHCKAGHSFDEANTRVSPEGWRHCRACERARNQSQKAVSA